MSEWKMVPTEPTEDMVVSGFESWPDRYFSTPEDWLAFEAITGCQQAAHKARLCYAAMLAAAPAGPVQSLTPIYQTRWGRPENVWGDVPKDAYDDYLSFGYADRRIVYAVAQPATGASDETHLSD
jgi:hypothetical protein